MKNRAILARMKAKKKKKKAPKKESAPEVSAKILGKDPETGEVVHTFDSFEAAAEADFKVANLKSSLKTGNKYKGHLWELSE